MTEVTIAPMNRTEIPQVADLWNDAVRAQGEGYDRHIQSKERLEKIVDDQNYLPEGALTAKQGNELIGFALGYVQTVDYLGEGGVDKIPARLAGIAVRPDKWRQGIGRSLLAFLENVLAEKGKKEISFPVHHKMPLVLVRSIHLDSGPFFFLKACGYENIDHELVFHNDIGRFELQDWVVDRKKRLEGEGFAFRWYRPEDREHLLPFMDRCFWPAWYSIIETATSSEKVPEIMLALKGDQIVAFIGPFDVGERRFYFSVDARTGWGGFGSPGVDPAFRQQGIGTILWHLGFDHLKRSGAKFTEYGTGLVNPAQHLYFHSGATLIEICCEDMRKVIKR
jgi:ribosomal protein S18 acetylase RimI-like enzyme